MYLLTMHIYIYEIKKLPCPPPTPLENVTNYTHIAQPANTHIPWPASEWVADLMLHFGGLVTHIIMIIIVTLSCLTQNHRNTEATHQ